MGTRVLGEWPQFNEKHSSCHFILGHQIEGDDKSHSTGIDVTLSLLGLLFVCGSQEFLPYILFAYRQTIL